MSKIVLQNNVLHSSSGLVSVWGSAGALTEHRTGAHFGLFHLIHYKLCRKWESYFLQHWGDLAGPVIVVVCWLYRWVGLPCILHVTSNIRESQSTDWRLPGQFQLGSAKFCVQGVSSSEREGVLSPVSRQGQFTAMFLGLLDLWLTATRESAHAWSVRHDTFWEFIILEWIFITLYNITPFKLYSQAYILYILVRL